MGRVFKRKEQAPPNKTETVVVAATNGLLDFGAWERAFCGQVERLARES